VANACNGVATCLWGSLTREAFLLHRFDGKGYAEIAKQLGISTKAVTDHIAKGRFLIDYELLRA
jgi:DNA-directed RNA polymerase specialized sigma24 family protein